MSENMVSSPKARLYGKIAKVTSEMTRVPKRGTQPKYKFATDTDIVESVRAALTKVNLAVITSMVSYRQMECKTQSGGQQWRTICEFEITLACGDTGEMLTARWFNESLDQSDKGFNKAAAAALKYFFMKTFLITTGEAEESGRETRQQQPPPLPVVDPETGEIVNTQPATPKKQQPRYGQPPQPAAWDWNQVIAKAGDYYKSDSKERFTTCNQLKTEGAFAACKSLDEAARLVAAQVKRNQEQFAAEGLPA
ncbi:MAG: ERF family protein [Anaerolineae bacterium]|nr:ERF family protein [Anaerolineae bacterium]